jgi:site-specific DNA-methyltransferase (adenine-specific)
VAAGETGAGALKPYYEHGGITIYHGDCREILPQLGKVDAVITDPPYNCGKDYGTSKDNMDPEEYAAMLGSIAGVEAGCHAWVTPHIRLALFAGLLETAYPVAIRRWAQGPIRGGWSDQFLTLLIKGKPRKAHSNLWDDVRLRDEGYLCKEEAYGHPGYTPILIMSRCISLLTNENAVVAEPFCGTGTTLVAAKNLGRLAIGIELEERYCEIAARRLSQEVLTFDEVPA